MVSKWRLQLSISTDDENPGYCLYNNSRKKYIFNLGVWELFKFHLLSSIFIPAEFTTVTL